MAEVSEEVKEIEPRGRILFINMSPTSDKPSIQIASGMFGQNSGDINEFTQIILEKINSPELLVDKKEKPGSLRQTKESSLSLPRVEDVSAVVITGSPFSPVLLTRELSKLGIDREGRGVFLPTWQKELVDFIKEAYRKGEPMLGECFGAAQIVEALGGKVQQIDTNEFGYPIEVGYSLIHRTSVPDPLFDGVPNEFVGITNRTKEIVRMPEGAEILAESRFGIQAFRIGVNVRGVMFHPEKTQSDADHLLEKEKGKFDPEEQVKLKPMFNSEIGKKILSNFLRLAWSDVQ